MKASAVWNVFIAGIASVAILCAAQSGLAQHGGHMGGGGFHAGGFHGGGFPRGGFHGNGFPGGTVHVHTFPVGVAPWRGGFFWGRPGFTFGIGVGVGIPGAFWAPYPYFYPYPYYGYGPYYAPYYYPPPCAYAYPPPYPCPSPYRYYPLSGPYGQNGSGSGGDPQEGTVAVQPYSDESTNYQWAQQRAAIDAELQQLPPERRQVMQNVIRALQAMPPEARQRQLASGRYDNFSPEEQVLLAKASLLPAASAQTRGSVARPPQ